MLYIWEVRRCLYFLLVCTPKVCFDKGQQWIKIQFYSSHALVILTSERSRWKQMATLNPVVEVIFKSTLVNLWQTVKQHLSNSSPFGDQQGCCVETNVNDTKTAGEVWWWLAGTHIGAQVFAQNTHTHILLPNLWTKLLHNLLSCLYHQVFEPTLVLHGSTLKPNQFKWPGS